MNERQMQFRVGVVVFATMIIGALLATLNSPLPSGWLPWGTAQYEIGIQLREAPGVNLNTPVRKNGILIGRVSAIEDLEDGIIVRAEVDGDRPLYAAYQPHVRTTVLGDAAIDFETRKLPPGAQPVPDGTVFIGVVDPNPFDAIAKLGDLQDDIERTMTALTRAGDEVSVLAKRVNSAFGDETEQGRVTRLLDTTERAMNQFAATMTSFNEIFGDDPSFAAQPTDPQRVFRAQPPFDGQQPPNGQRPTNVQPPAGGVPPVNGAEMRRRIRQGLYELPDAIREARVTMRDFRVVLESAEKNFKNLEGFTEPLGQRGGEIADSLIDAVEGLDVLFDDLSVLTQALNNREGTVGQLIHNPQVYDNLNLLMCNANTVLGQINDLTLRLKPVVNDARIFMDKIATEPGRIVTGGINPSVVK